MHCRYFVETKTLWEYLVRQLLYSFCAHDIAGMVKSLQLWQACLRRCGADHAWLCLRRLLFRRGTAGMSTRDTLFRFSGF